MPLINCPECAHEVSTTATACPNCGHPFAPSVTRTKTVIQDAPPSDDGIPKWIFIPLGLLGVVLLFFLLTMMNNRDDTAETNINVNLAGQTSVTDSAVSTTPNDIDIPASTTTVDPPDSSVPTTIPPDAQTTVISPDTLPGTGTVNLEAKVVDTKGNIQAVRAEKFYLLEKDLDTILREADIKDDTNQGLKNAFGLSVLYPDKYPGIREKALDKISEYVKYETLTDTSGKAKMDDVNPGGYYLFGITKTDKGFAIWSSPVTIKTGENPLKLQPVRPTEIAR